MTSRSVRAVVLVIALAGACNGSAGSSADADSEGEGERDVAAEAGADGSDGGGSTGESDAELEARPGPLTFVTSGSEAILDRLCDLDGDGLADNAFADLGTTNGILYAQIITASLVATLESGDVGLFIFPWVDDVSRPADERTTMIFCEGNDLDRPLDPTDNASGEEPFRGDPVCIDACGEPLFFDDGASIDRGTVSASDVVLAINLGSPIPLHNRQISGQIEPGGSRGELESCGYFDVGDIGDVMSEYSTGEFTLLELLAVGGDVSGMSALPGVGPDVDLDGDGLESFVIDDDDHIVGCIDGDSTVIDGADCWADERIADGYSLNLRFEVVSAVFAGLEPSWEDQVEGTCDEPPEESLWDPH